MSRLVRSDPSCLWLLFASLTVGALTASAQTITGFVPVAPTPLQPPPVAQTSYGYDARGNATKVLTPDGRLATQKWDALGRKVFQSFGSAANAGSVATVTQGYDGQDGLTSVTDPKGLTTTYTRDGLGQVLSLQSPDTGNSSQVFDTAGRLTKQTTAYGLSASYFYDRASRMVSKTVSNPGGADISYFYTYAVSGPATGYLTKVDAPYIGLLLTYGRDLNGQITQASQTVSPGPSLSVSYSYTTSQQPSQITYPSGLVVNRMFNASGQLQALTYAGPAGSGTVLDQVRYTSFGSLAGWQFGSGRAVTRTFDLKGRLTSTSMPAGPRTYRYDTSDRIVASDDPLLGHAAYAYDDQDRLVSAATDNGRWTYAYDANGNRISHTIDEVSYTDFVESGSNRWTGQQGPMVRQTLYRVDGQPAFTTGTAQPPQCGGSTMSPGFTAQGQMTLTNSMLATFGPDGLRLKKTPAPCAGGFSTNFVYDQSGHLTGEYTDTGAVIQETVWLGDAPVAVFKPASATPYFIYSDNLQTPRSITNAAGQVVWQWDGEPFGASLAQESPSGLEPFSYNLRFAGQYFDKETGLHQNRWREYDPAVGRYLQSDPIGLAGGLNTYGYADGSPTTKVDLLGLATYMCTQPLHALGAAGDLLYGPSWNPLYHQFLGILRPDGSVITGGQDRAAGPWGPGKPSEGDGTSGKQTCEKAEDDNDCIEKCLMGKFSQPRPNYGLVLGGAVNNGKNCQGWANGTLAQCRSQCKGKK